MKTTILGISGSPIKKGNVETFLHHILQSVSNDAVECQEIYLSSKKIFDCNHCNFCLKKQTRDNYCACNDDAQEIFHAIESADILVLASPVYFMRTSGRMASLIDRLRIFMYGNITKGKVKNKIGASAAVAWNRHGGLETTHLSHITAFLTLEMIPASSHDSISPLGASYISSLRESDGSDNQTNNGILTDDLGMASGITLLNRAIELATLVKKRGETNSL